MRLGILITILGAGCSLSAQWLHYPTPGIPRLPNGKPNLSAPVPRTPDGHPDLTGIWQLDIVPCPPDVIDTCGNESDGGAREFSDIGVHVTGGVPYQPWAAELVKKHTEDLGKDDPAALCKPAGALRILTFPLYRKILQTPPVTVILSERDVTYRQIFTDGRPLPKDPEPTWNGYSIGKWQGDSFVVQTVGLKDGTWLDRRGSPLTEGAKMTEKFRRTNFGRLEIEVTIDDPKAYTKPWTVRLPQHLITDTELLDYHCNENEKDAVHAIGK